MAGTVVRTVVFTNPEGTILRTEMGLEQTSLALTVASEQTMLTDRIIVTLLPDYTEKELLDYLGSRSDVDLVRKLAIDTYTVALRASSVAGYDATFASLKNAPILEVEPDYWYTTDASIPNDTYFSQLWGMHNTGQYGTNDNTQSTRPNWDALTNQTGAIGADIGATKAWDYQTGSPGVVVAVIDTGVNYNHADLVGNMWKNSGEIPGNGIDDDGNGYIDDVHGIRSTGTTVNGNPADDVGHGTHVAGTIGAMGNDSRGVVGVTRDVEIMALKFLTPSGGSTSDAITCIDYAISNGADVMNNSWGGGGFSTALRNAIARARDAGILFVASAGNNATNNDVTPHYPSSYVLENYPTAGSWDNVIAVAATDRLDRLAYTTRPDLNPTGLGSAFGATSVDVGAPGTAIVSTYLGAFTPYARATGTSMASPHVSGVLAMMRYRFPSDTGEDLKVRLESSVKPRSALSGKTKTGGRIHLNRSLSVFSIHPKASLPFFEREVSWFGYVDDSDYPEIWHGLLGALVVWYGDTDEGSFSVAMEDMDNRWMWTGNESYPYFYRYDDDAWLYFSPEINPPDFYRYFYNMSTGVWEAY